MSQVYIYVVDRDFGFAPNPFHGSCTLATCKPRLRRVCKAGDWVIGVGGRRLKATGRCVFAMRVTKTMSFDRYWHDPGSFDKRPVRNGSLRMMVGDNVYSRDPSTGQWHQADSHHSNSDGTPNPHNLNNDTGIDRVLISTDYFYFGKSAPLIPVSILEDLGYRNGRNYRSFSLTQGTPLIAWLHDAYGNRKNLVVDDPFDFDNGHKRYSVHGNKIS
ncbi:MAG: hypothetical protein ABL961_04115 [Vicinamibacterales bacterium]